MKTGTSFVLNNNVFGFMKLTLLFIPEVTIKLEHITCLCYASTFIKMNKNSV